MGYIKKLKNNELVGGTDKTTIYPVTSTEAVFEEITNGNESSFKSQKTINKEQQDELDEHDDRLNTAETEDIKGITINHSETVHTVEEGTNIVNLTIYTAETADDQAIAGLVEQNYNNIIANTNAINAEKNRAESIEGGLQTQVTALDNGKQVKLSVGAGITLTQDGVISATADPSVAKVVEELPTGDDIVDGLIYLKKTNTAGTYSQHVHSTSGWSSNLPNVSLGITTDDAIDSTSTNPIQNNAITAQIGYFVCGDSNGSSATKNVDAPSYSPSDVGGAFKIKMNYANTSTGTVYLRFNSDDTTKKELRYNREPVTPTNTWESPEVISVYYDGTYYQASNAMGGGSAVGKKIINPTATNRAITTNGDTIGAVITNNTTNWCYAKYAVNEGDMVMISGTGGSSPRLWAIADVQENILSKEETINATREDFVLVMPAGAKWIVLNNSGNEYPDYKWYYAKAGSVGAHEMLTEAYLYGDLKTLAVGQTYDKNEAVKTTDRQLLRVTKEIQGMNLVDEVSIGDLKAVTSGNELGTYQALKAVVAYDEEGEYSSGDYAIADGVVKIYDGEAWTAVVLADWVADANMWASLDDEDLLTHTEQNSIQKEINSGSSVYNKLIDQELRSSMYAINENGKYGAGDVYYHFWCPVQQGQKYMIVPTNTVRYCFAKSHTVTKSGNIDLVDDTSVVILSKGETRIIEIPPTCNFLLLYFYDSTSHVYKYKDFLDDFPDIEKVKDCFYEKDVTSLVGTWACDDPTQIEINGNVWTLKKASNASGRIYINVSNLTNGLLYRIHLKIVSSDKNGAVLSSLGYGSTKTNTWINVPVIKGRGSFFSFPYGNILDAVFEKTSDMSYVFLGSANSSQRTDYPVVITVDDFYVNEYASFSTNYSSLEQAVNELHNNSSIPSTLPPNYTYERYMELMTSQIYDRSSQAGCCYGNYFVQAFAANNSGNMGFRIYNLETKSLIQRVNLSGVDNHQTHANAISFSINKYAEEDLFPLLYVPSGYPLSGTTTYQIYVIRFIGDTLGSLTAQIIQTINYEGSSWTDCVCDDAKERLWIITGGTCECIELPDISNQTVTIDANIPRLHSFKIQPLRYSFGTTFISGQGMFFSQGRIWHITGVPHSEREGSGSARIVVYNTKNMCTESMIFLEDIGLVPENTEEYEPESIFIWNNQLYAAFRGFIARIIKIDLV